AREFHAVAAPEHVIPRVRARPLEKAAVAFGQLDARGRHVLIGSAGVERVWRTRIGILPSTAHWRTVPLEGGHQHRTTLLQILVNAAEPAEAIQLERGETEPGEHEQQHEAMPELEPPADGVEEHDQPSMA